MCLPLSLAHSNGGHPQNLPTLPSVVHSCPFTSPSENRDLTTPPTDKQGVRPSKWVGSVYSSRSGGVEGWDPVREGRLVNKDPRAPTGVENEIRETHSLRLWSGEVEGCGMSFSVLPSRPSNALQKYLLKRPTTRNPLSLLQRESTAPKDGN